MPAPAPGGLFDRLKGAGGDVWAAYVGHAFVRRLADGTLRASCFRHYLAQDYLFLKHFARAYALAVYKSGDLDDMRGAASTLTGILEVEMDLHVRFSMAWDLSREDMSAVSEATATMAYTRYVLETGMAGDVLDLYVALSPCVVGYAEIGAYLAADPATKREGNPYRAWIEMYAGAEYQEVARGMREQLEGLAKKRLTEGRFPDLARIFVQATKLEAAFWQMGLDLSD